MTKEKLALIICLVSSVTIGKAESMEPSWQKLEQAGRIAYNGGNQELAKYYWAQSLKQANSPGLSNGSSDPVKLTYLMRDINQMSVWSLQEVAKVPKSERQKDVKVIDNLIGKLAYDALLQKKAISLAVAGGCNSATTAPAQQTLNSCLSGIKGLQKEKSEALHESDASSESK